MSGADVSFVHLGISIPHMVKSFSIGGISFAYYGLIIGIGMILGLCVAQSDAKRRGQNPDIYLDFALYGIIFSIIGARIYYVFFQWAYYKDHLMEIVNLRKGGLAIYGGDRRNPDAACLYKETPPFLFVHGRQRMPWTYNRTNDRTMGELYQLRGLRPLHRLPVCHADQAQYRE